MGIRLIMRTYFSSYLLWTAQHMSARVRELEAEHSGDPRFDIRQRSLVLSAVLAAANFLEAMVNELYQDALDEHGVTGDGYIAPLAPDTRRLMAQVWSATDEGAKLRPLDKYQLLLTFAAHEPLDPGTQPFQDAYLLVQLRNAIAHYQPSDLSADSPTMMEKRLRGKFADNPLLRGSGNPWWPDHCLGYGCADWAWKSAVALTDRVSDELGIRPNYVRMSDSDWSGFLRPPGMV